MEAEKFLSTLYYKKIERMRGIKIIFKPPLRARWVNVVVLRKVLIFKNQKCSNQFKELWIKHLYTRETTHWCNESNKFFTE